LMSPSNFRLRAHLIHVMVHQAADDHPSDADLVHAGRGGDGLALGTLLDRHRAALYSTRSISLAAGKMSPMRSRRGSSSRSLG